MKKSLNIITTAVLSVGLLTTTLTAYPQTLTQTLPYEANAAQMVQSVAEEIKESDTNNESQAVAATATIQSKPTTTVAPRPRTQTSQASRGGVQPSAAKSTTSTSKATAIINTAKQYIGVKYVWGGTTPSGFDCSGYTQYVFAKHGISLPRVSRDQYNVGTSVSFSNLKAGDLVFFSLDGDKVIDHVGIFIGNGQFINASSSKGVTIYTLGSYWQSKYIGAKRIL